MGGPQRRSGCLERDKIIFYCRRDSSDQGDDKKKGLKRVLTFSAALCDSGCLSREGFASHILGANRLRNIALSQTDKTNINYRLGVTK